MEASAGLSTEIVLLGWSVVLLVVQIALQASTAAPELGTPYLMGPRDDVRKPAGLYAGRMARALQNLLETYPAFVALALALEVTDHTGGLGAIGAHLWFWMRIVYIPIYAFGIPVVRTVIYVASMVGLLLMLIALLT